MTNVAEAERRVRTALGDARDRFEAALLQPDAGARPAALQFAGEELRVDLRRRIVAAPGDPGDWAGSTIDNGHALGRLLLGLFVGPVRFLDADAFRRCVIAAGRREPGYGLSAIHAALFLNLTVAEPALRPEHELAIWVVAARKLAGARPHTDLHGLLPPLWTADDPSESAGGSDGRDLAGDRQTAREQRWSALYVDLVRSLVPASRDELDAPGGSIERYAIARSHDDDLRAFVRDNLFAAVARELDNDRTP